MNGMVNLSNLFFEFKNCEIQVSFLTQVENPKIKQLNYVKIVPLISSGTAGPNGVLHLPRLWQKVSKQPVKSPTDIHIGVGYDSMVIDALGLMPMQFVPSLPTLNPPIHS